MHQLNQFDGVLRTYFAIQSALAGDDASSAADAAVEAGAAIDAIDKTALEGETHAALSDYEYSLRGKFATIAESADNIAQMRRKFEPLSDELTMAIRSFGSAKNRRVYRHFCPMAFDNKGAHWLQADDKTLNPYFGSEMLMCGEVVEMISTENHK